MRQLVILCIGIFLVVWGLGVFLAYLAGLKTITLPAPKSNMSGPAYLEEQRRIADDTEEGQRKVMQDYRYQIQKYKNTHQASPSMGRF